MAANKKFNQLEVVNQLRHVLREVKYPKNIDIDKSKSHLNYSLSPKRDISEMNYLKKRLSEVHVANRAGINLMSGWIITKPKELDDIHEKAFFESCYEFLKERYGGEKNVISCEIHKDESGEPHMHFLFVPVTKNTPNENMLKVAEYIKKNPDKNNTQAAKELGVDRKTVRRYRNKTEDDIKYEKLSAKEVINRAELQSFHKDLQAHLNKNGISASVNSGITKARGGNMTVEQLKLQRAHLLKHGEKISDVIDNIDRNITKMEDFEI